jgi:hypothetical protein
MATDKWNGSGDWNLNSSNWSSGVLTSSTPAEIQTGTSTISTSGTAQWLTIDSGAELYLDSGTSLTLANWLNNAGYWILNGGDTASIGGRLTNTGTIDIGGTSISASTTVTAASLNNTGTIYLQGNAASGATSKATLDITGAAAPTLTGSMQVAGDATLEFGSGGITTIGTGATLQLDGPQAKILTNAGAKTALSGLAANNGTLLLRGDSGYGARGAALTTTTSFTNYDYAEIDYYGSDGGSTVTFGGTLTNDYDLYIGNAGLSAATTVKATTLANNGTLVLQGNSASGATSKASLILSGAAAATVTGSLQVAGSATLEFGTGGITTVGAGATLQLDGSGAQILTGATTALSGLTTNYGTLLLRGGSGYGAGGVTLTTTSTPFTNYDYGEIDYYGDDGGSAVTFGGTLTNNYDLYIGNTGLSASTTVKAATLANNGTLDLQGNNSSGTTDKASLILSGAASATSTGTVRVSGDAVLQFGSGSITSVGSGASLELDGSGAQILSGSTSALSSLAANYGTLIVNGDTSYGAGGAALTTTKAFLNNDDVYIDSYYGGSGGSSVTFGGILTNNGTLDIGNTGLSASTTVNASTLYLYGTVIVQGNASSGTTDKASLISSAKTLTEIAGNLRVSGDATLEFASGGITYIGPGHTLELDGSGAQVLTDNGKSSALSTLTTDYGTLELNGGISYGAGGASVTTAKAFANYGNIYVDSYYGGSGGSTATFGGTLTNDGTTDIGNTDLSASTTVKATTLVNNDTLVVQGNTTSGTTNKASLILSGKAAAASTGYVRVSGDATLEFGSGGITSVGAGGQLELDGSGAQILTSAGASSALSGLTANSGTLELNGGSGYGAGGASLTTTKALTNSLNVYIDSYYGGDGGSKATFGGTLTNSGTLDIGNTDLSASTTVQAKTFVNSGSLTLQGNTASGTTNKATFDLTGAAASTSTGTVRVSGDATLEFGSGGITTVAAGSWLELDGSAAQILSGASSALLGLATNNGTLFLNGDSGYGAGGASLTTTSGTNFTNDGNLWVDSYYGGSGGSTATFGGTLTNEGTVDIGNTGLSAATTVTVDGLSNAGTVLLAGDSSFLGELVVDGAASSSSSMTIGANSKLDVTGSNSFTQTGGATTVDSGGSLVAATIDANGGLLDYVGAITSSVGALNIGDLGNLEFSSSVSSSQAVTFAAADGTLSLGDAAAFSGTIHGFASNDAIDLLSEPVTGLSYSGNSSSGTLTVSGSSGTIATLAFSGNYTTSSFTFASDGHRGTNILHT